MKAVTPFRVAQACMRQLALHPVEFLRYLAHAAVDFRDGRFQAAYVERALTDYFQDSPRHLLNPQSLEAIFPGIEPPLSPVPANMYTQEDWAELPPKEYSVLRTIVRYCHPKTVLEIGTYKGRTTRLLAEEAAEGAAVYTLDMPPERVAEGGCFWPGDGRLVGQQILSYRGPARIVQLFGDSRSFDFSPYCRGIDLLFIDGDHGYNTVLSDSLQALEMISSGGTIIWDDYHPAHGPGVMRALAELSEKRPLAWIRGTRFAIYRDTHGL